MAASPRIQPNPVLAPGLDPHPAHRPLGRESLGVWKGEAEGGRLTVSHHSYADLKSAGVSFPSFYSAALCSPAAPAVTQPPHCWAA